MNYTTIDWYKVKINSGLRYHQLARTGRITRVLKKMTI